MKRKTISCIIIALFLVFNIWEMPIYIGSAQTNVIYKRVITDETPFYSDNKGANLLFYLPKSYYVKILSEEGAFYHVECFLGEYTPTLDGYVPSYLLSEVSGEVSSPYLSLHISTLNSCPLYTDQSLAESIQFVFADRTLGYYGNLKRDNKETLYFVCYNGKLGYVKESDVAPFSVPLHTTPLPQQVEKNEGVDKTTPSDATVNGLRTAIILCLLGAGLVAFCVSLKRNSKNAITYYDENDYE